ncbi:MAG: hypothetical protein ABIV63_21605 [Caldimonas sp.]
MSTMSLSHLLLGVLFGSLGLGYFVYGKKQHAGVPLVCGLALMAFPYFVSNTASTMLIGVLLSALPFIIRR